MSYTLWQAGVLLGKISLPFRAQDPLAVGGMFEPTPAFDAVGPIVQTRARELPGAPLVQQPFRRRDGLDPHPSSRLEAIDIVGLRPAAEGERDLIPPDRRLELRDEVDAPVATDVIAVMELPASWATMTTGLPTLCGQLGIRYSGLYLGARRA